MRGRLTAGRAALDREARVRILLPQPYFGVETAKLRIVYLDLTIAGSFNGRTAGFGPAYGSSNLPSAAFFTGARKVAENEHADIAQLGEHPPCKWKVVGSNPTIGSGLRMGQTKWNQAILMCEHSEVAQWESGGIIIRRLSVRARLSLLTEQELRRGSRIRR